jgi:uncharacterized surface protein with fasciclin (FAS1) repeats
MKSSLSVAALRLTTLLLAAVVLLMAVPRVEAKAPKMRDIADTIDTNVITSKFAQMLQASDLGTFLSSRGPFTVFVPTDSAFSKLPPGEFETMLRPENKERLQAIVLFHVVNNKRLSGKDLLLLKTVVSCQGTPLALRTSHSGAQFIMKAKITHADIRCANGIINQIDSVLMPPETALPPLAAAPPPGVTPVTNAAPVNPVTMDNAHSPETTNAVPVVPVAPAAVPSH